MDKLKLVLIASDHAGVALKTALQKTLPQWVWQDLGPTDSTSVDYPDFAASLAEAIIQGKASYGVLICGSGIGMCIAANKFPGIRATVVENTTTAKLSREHNHANVLCLGARFLTLEHATEITKIWLETPFSDDPRHKNRIQKITALESKRK